MTAPSIGYASTFPNDDVTQILGPDFSKIGLCSTSADADATVFPLNVAVRFTSTDPDYLSKIGTGDLAAALTGINDQLNGDGADVVLVRVAASTAVDAAVRLAETQANIIGSAGAGTGMWALRNAPQTVKAAPRLIYVGCTYQPGVDGADNPVRAALAPMLEAMKAISIVDVRATSKVDAIADREFMSSKRMMPLGVAVKVYETINGAATLVTRSGAPRILGIIAATDNNYRRGMPFDSFCNKPVLGIADISRPIGYDLGDGSTEAQLMLAQDIAVIVKGESADVGAIADGGFVFLGVESAATNDLWSQIHQVRAADYIDVETAKLVRLYLGQRITPRAIEALMTSIGNMLRDHVAFEDILGFKLEFPRALNSVAQIREGHIFIRTRHEPAPVLRVVHNEVRRYPDAVTALIDAIVSTVGEQSAVITA